MSSLSATCYGKDNVRLFKVRRDSANPRLQYVTEFTVRVMLEGAFDEAYTVADNCNVVTTDTMKNTTYITAKQNPVNPPELFATILGTHFVKKYDHISTATIHIVEHKWTRYEIDGDAHPHAFVRDGEDIRTCDAIVAKDGSVKLSTGIEKLLVLKSTGSAFHGYIQDEYTTLPETWDRIMSTEVEASWKWKEYSGVDEVKAKADEIEKGFQIARKTTLDTFATHESASVQATLFKTAQDILSQTTDITEISYALPNKHYFEIDLSWHNGLKNTGVDAEVYAPQSNPNGLITATIKRD
ncbi:uncharacterized protein V1510DRAFT_426810 [Dipodascopsis tothii]|uniref:uncharacterized protein n=1 Tax=Dipodascopsis tothii TaxID=44089 RepID=UPI0034CE4149